MNEHHTTQKIWRMVLFTNTFSYSPVSVTMRTFSSLHNINWIVVHFLVMYAYKTCLRVWSICLISKATPLWVLQSRYASRTAQKMWIHIEIALLLFVYLTRMQTQVDRTVCAFIMLFILFILLKCMYFILHPVVESRTDML